MAHSKSEIKKAKNLLNKYAPKGEQLAYINPKEANLLKSKGGAGKMTKAGIRSYAYSDSRDDPGGANQTSGSSNNGGGNNSGGDNPYEGIASKPAPQKSMLSKAGSGVVDYIKRGGTIGLVARTIGKVFSNIGGRISQRKNKIGIDDARLSGSFFVPNSNKNYNLDRGIGDNNGSNNTPPPTNVGGKIIKLAPTSAEISQSKATDVTYDSRKTKARGRSMTIRTNSKGVGNNMASVLGKKSLLGAA